LASPFGSRYSKLVMVTTEPGLRNLDQLQEQDEHAMPRGATIALVVLGGACVVFAALALGGRASQPQAPKSDPLGDLVSRRATTGASGQKPTDLRAKDVTFPQMLSDEPRPTTALAALRPAGAPPSSAIPTAEPPPPTERLPVVPLPAQAVLEATPIVTRPRDPLTKAASDAAQITTPPRGTDTAPEGHAGGYQLQVSSFHTQAEAEAFAEQLRARGHRAYAVEARVPGRGTWYRVRIGPFATQHAVTQYRAAFEAREHVVPFVVTPDPADKPRQE
jgi:DedD protein